MQTDALRQTKFGAMKNQGHIQVSRGSLFSLTGVLNMAMVGFSKF
jgi:hypothetical protein